MRRHKSRSGAGPPEGVAPDAAGEAAREETGAPAAGIRQRLREAIRQEIDGCRELSDEQLYEIIDRRILEAAGREYLPLKEQLQLRRDLFNGFRKLDLLQQLMDNPEITEVMINGKETFLFSEGNKWFVEAKGAAQ